jgi:protein-tyrosine sulfotransferase
MLKSDRITTMLDPIRMLRRLYQAWDNRRFQRSSFYRGRATSNADAIFIVGCGRSGTTLLRAMLERHPRLWGGPESWLFVQRVDPVIFSWKFRTDPRETRALLTSCSTAIEFAERYFGQCTVDAGKSRWVEKTPRHVHSLSYLLTSFPNARFIHMIRDGRDVACSLRNHPKAAVRRRGVVPLKVNNPISFCINRWVADTSAGLALQSHPRVLTIRYESLVRDTESTLRQVCDFVGETFVRELMQPAPESTPDAQSRAPSNLASFETVNASSIGRWTRDLSPAELQTCLQTGGALLESLGYLSKSLTPR